MGSLVTSVTLGLGMTARRHRSNGATRALAWKSYSRNARGLVGNATGQMVHVLTLKRLHAKAILSVPCPRNIELAKRTKFLGLTLRGSQGVAAPTAHVKRHLNVVRPS